jgi:hypothetical protein
MVVFQGIGIAGKKPIRLFAEDVHQRSDISNYGSMRVAPPTGSIAACSMHNMVPPHPDLYAAIRAMW